jgi:predicted phage terminase large subunit-like protein
VAEDFIAWFAGRHPDRKIIYASYSNELGNRCNANLQRMMKGERYRQVFPNTRIGVPGWSCSSDLVEFAGHRGSFRNTTVDGQINGMELHLGVLDDPMKGRAEVNSKPVRDRVWNWYADDWSTRFAAQSAELIITTRWHTDDPLGRLIERVPDVKKIRYSAIAESDEEYRRAGEALFPDLKPLEFLLAIKRIQSRASWEAEYQQNPITVGGGMFPIEKLLTLPYWDRRGIRRSVRYWDKAASVSEDAAFSCGVLMHHMLDGRFVIEDVVRGKWTALAREQHIKQWAEHDSAVLDESWKYEIGVEQEPGSGGKESAENTIRNLAGFRPFADRVTGSKEVRAQPFAAQVQAGNVWLVAGAWHCALLDEMESFPNGRFQDQVDACSGAFNRLASRPRSTFDMGWMD